MEDKWKEIMERIQNEEELDNFFDNVKYFAGLLNASPLIYSLKCRMLVDSEIEDQLREYWKMLHDDEVTE